MHLYFTIILVFQIASTQNINYSKKYGTTLTLQDADETDTNAEPIVYEGSAEYSDEKKNINIESTIYIEVYENFTQTETSPSDALLELQNILQLEWSEVEPTSRHLQPPPMISPPQFISELYAAISSDKNQGIIPHGASTVVAIPEKIPNEPQVFYFDLSGISLNDDDDFLEAELHLYRLGSEDQDINYYPPYYLIRVYQVMSKIGLSYLNPDVHFLLNVHYISALTTGWQVFKVTKAVESWLNGTSENLGLLVHASTVLGEPVDMKFARKGLSGDFIQPSLTIFTKPSNEGNDSLKQSSEEYIRSKTTFSLKCSHKPLFVNFQSFGWDKWIISPKGFQAGMCEGYCGFKLDEDATNHAKIKSLLRELGYSDVSIPCCVPTELLPLTILYYNDFGNVVLKSYHDMRVGKCGCR